MQNLQNGGIKGKERAHYIFGVYLLGRGNRVSMEWLLKECWRILILMCLMKCFAQILLMLQS